MAVSEAFQFLVPFLLTALCLVAVFSRFGGSRTAWRLPLVATLSAGLTFIPFLEFSLAEYLLSLNPHFSLGSLALAIMLLLPWVFPTSPLPRGQLFLFCGWNVGLSVALFSSCLGIIPVDLYAWGYGFSLWFVIMAGLTLGLIVAGSPLAVVFLAYIAAFDLKLLPSANFFDYLTDGFLLLLSAGVLVWGAVGNPKRVESGDSEEES